MNNKTYNPAEFPPFAVTVDLVVLTVGSNGLDVLLVRRDEGPHNNKWALPGGFVGPEQGLLDAAQSKLTHKTGINIDTAHLEQLGTFGAPDRDPRMRVVSVTYLALVPDPGQTPEKQAAWHSTNTVDFDTLAFDHGEILRQGIERARAKLEYTTLATAFCDEPFTVVELRGVYEAVWGESLDPANFHRKVLGCSGFLEATNATVHQGRGRPAQLYRAGSARTLSPPIARSVTR